MVTNVQSAFPARSIDEHWPSHEDAEPFPDASGQDDDMQGLPANQVGKLQTCFSALDLSLAAILHALNHPW